MNKDIVPPSHSIERDYRRKWYWSAVLDFAALVCIIGMLILLAVALGPNPLHVYHG